MNPAARWMWLALICLADIVGLLFGMSMFAPDFWLDPAAGLLAFFAVIVLGITMWKLEEPND